MVEILGIKAIDAHHDSRLLWKTVPPSVNLYVGAGVYGYVSLQGITSGYAYL